MRFVTGSSAASDGGPSVVIWVRWLVEPARVPTACTCANTLVLSSRSGPAALRRALEMVLFDCGQDWGSVWPDAHVSAVLHCTALHCTVLYFSGCIELAAADTCI